MLETDPILTEPFTRNDYQQLPEGFPAELLDGRLVRSPSPTFWHQTLVGKIMSRLQRLVDPPRVVPSPIDVFIDRYNVLQPDVIVVAEEDRARPGARIAPLPVMVFEVLSPSTARRDRLVKAGTYLRAGVREVWLIDPDGGEIEVRAPDGEARFSGDEDAGSTVLPEFRLSWNALSQ